MDNNDWLKNLKAGDTVIVSPGASYNPDYLSEVTKTTATQIHCGNWKFRKQDGRQMGGNAFYTAWLEEPTPAAIEAIRLREEISRLALRFSHSMNWYKLPLAALEQIERIISENAPKEKGK